MSNTLIYYSFTTPGRDIQKLILPDILKPLTEAYGTTKYLVIQNFVMRLTKVANSQDIINIFEDV